MKNKFKEIFDGWKNVLFTDEEIEILSAERMAICNECPFKEEVDLMGLRNEICGECWCPLKAKTRSPESKCPKDKWNR